jgi:hypothetical protein
LIQSHCLYSELTGESSTGSTECREGLTARTKRFTRRLAGREFEAAAMSNALVEKAV